MIGVDDMTDTERAVTGLENLRDAILNDYIRETDQAVRTIDDALALLKEQKKTIESLEYELAMKTDMLNHYLNGNE